MPTTFVTITLEQFVDALEVAASNLRLGKPYLEPGTKGIFHIPVVPSATGGDPLITIKVSTSLASGGATMGHGEASMSITLHSPKQNRNLIGMKKGTGKTHLKRTKNWDKTLEGDIKKVLEKFRSMERFFLVLARYGELDTYFQRAEQIIQAWPNWRQDRRLVAIHEKIQRKSVLEESEEKLLGEIAKKGREMRSRG